MVVKQVSIFIENSMGRLAEVMELLSGNGINLRALSIADTKDYGVLRIIVNDYKKAMMLLKNENYMVSLADVIAIAVDDTPGGLSSALKILEKAEVAVEYMYAFIGKDQGRALVILRVDDTEKAISSLLNTNIRVIEADTVYKM